MIYSVVLLILGIVFFLCFLTIALRFRPGGATEMQPVVELRKIVNLPGLSFAGANLLLDNRDYKMLRRQPALQQVARQLRRERRTMVLSWLNDLQGDVRTLWRFRRFLVCNGVQTGFLEETDIAMTAMLAHALLLSLRILISVAGPFALEALLQSTRHQVEVGALICAGLLGKLPSASRLEVERRWAKEIA
jgi:hypothetical protein